VTSRLHSVAPGLYVRDSANGGAPLSAGALTLDGVIVRGNVAASSSGSWSFFVIPSATARASYTRPARLRSPCTFEDNHAIGGTGPRPIRTTSRPS
jgi:hypothetical protein